MPETATVIGPVVRMCEDPGCHGAMACPSDARDRARITDRTVGVCEVAGFRTTAMERHLGVLDGLMRFKLARQLARNYAPDSHGIRRMIPDGCEFTVHKGNQGIPPEMLAGHEDGEWYVAVYSGPATCIDGILEDAPQYDEEAAAERERRMPYEVPGE